MSTLKIKAYGLTHTKYERNADNLYYNGTFLTNARDEQYAFDEEYTANIQIFAVSDAGAKAKDRDIAARNGELVMSSISALQVDMESENQVDKPKIWNYLNEANDRVISRGHQNDMEMQVSFSGLFFQGNRVFAAHVGDTRIYCIRDHSIVQISADNLAINDLFSRGVISQEKMDLHKKNSQLSAYIGMEGLDEIKASLFTKYYLFQPGDIFFLCSDGITDTFYKDEMEELVKGMTGLKPTDILDLMSKRAQERNNDDYSMILLTVEEVGDNTRTEPASSSLIKKAAFSTPLESKPVEEPKEEDYPQDDMGDTKPMQAIKDEPVYRAEPAYEEEEPRPVVTKTQETNQFDPAAFSQNLLNNEENDLEVEENEDFDDEDDDEDGGRMRKPVIAACIVIGAILLVVIACFGIKILSSNNKEKEESSKPESKYESVIESEVESEEESEVESEPESIEESQEESEPVEELIATHTVKSGESWWGIVNKYYGSKYCSNKYYAALKDYNGLSQTVVLKVGMEIKLPTKEILEILAKDWE